MALLYDFFLVGITSPHDLETNLVQRTLRDLDMGMQEKLYPIELYDPENEQVLAAGVATEDACNILGDENVKNDLIRHIMMLLHEANKNYSHTWAFQTSDLRCVFIHNAHLRD